MAPKVSRSQTSLFALAERKEDLREEMHQAINDRISACRCAECKLWKGRRKALGGVGNIMNPAVAFVTEAPSNNDDLDGNLFAKRSQVYAEFDWMVGVLGLKREQVYLCAMVCCHVYGGRKPTVEQIHACAPFLEEQLALVKPLVVVGLGANVARGVMRSEFGFNTFRGDWHLWRGRVYRFIDHPSALLQAPGKKSLMYTELKTVKRRIDALTTQ